LNKEYVENGISKEMLIKAVEVIENIKCDYLNKNIVTLLKEYNLGSEFTKDSKFHMTYNNTRGYNTCSHINE
jgi:hypothetical protein